MLNSKNGIVWITGASYGIGREIAIQLLKNNFTVAITARSENKLLEIKKEYPKALVFPGDILDVNRMNSIVTEIEKIDPISLAILNAGGIFKNKRNSPLDESFKKTLDLNLNGTINCLDPVIKSMTKRKSGHIAIMSSVSGYSALPNFSDGYIVSKSSVIKIAELLKVSLKKFNIKVQLITPSFIDTGLISKKLFHTPFVYSTERSARIIIKGLSKNRFEIGFPKIAIIWFKTARMLPYSIYFAVSKFTMFVIRKKKRFLHR